MVYTFFTFASSSMSDMLGYVGDFITDITPLLLIVVAVGIGLIILYGIIGAIRGR